MAVCPCWSGPAGQSRADRQLRARLIVYEPKGITKRLVQLQPEQLAATNRQWVQQHGLFEPGVQRFLTRLRRLSMHEDSAHQPLRRLAPAWHGFRPYYLARGWVRARAW